MTKLTAGFAILDTDLTIISSRVYVLFPSSDEQDIYTSPVIRPMEQSMRRALPLAQGGSNMTGTDLYVNKPHCAAAVRP